VIVLDISGAALERARTRLGPRRDLVTWIEADVTGDWSVAPVDIWHDRAVFHFLTEPADRAHYVAHLRETVKPGGTVIIATFALDGPEKCSGLPVVRYSGATLGRELGPELRLAETASELPRPHSVPFSRSATAASPVSPSYGVTIGELQAVITSAIGGRAAEAAAGLRPAVKRPLPEHAARPGFGFQSGGSPAIRCSRSGSVAESDTMDPSRVFLSKRDWWLTAIVWGGVATMLLPSLLQPRSANPTAGFMLFAVLIPTIGALFMLWVLYGTSYTFAGDLLVIRSGPFRFRVTLTEVRSVEPTRSPLSSPACSLDRLLIRYGVRQIMVSPADKAGFLAELQMRCPQVRRVNC
jgi:hypothetical protein